MKTTKTTARLLLSTLLVLLVLLVSCFTSGTAFAQTFCDSPFGNWGNHECGNSNSIMCGSICNGTIQCGQCQEGETCQFQPEGPIGPSNFWGGVNFCCGPATCLSNECGTMPDGCGGTVDCGPCPACLNCDTVGTCGNFLDDGCGGTINCACPCQPNNICGDNKNCGALDDGCGNTLDCGACPVGDNCISNQCVCPPTTCAAERISCGYAPDGCGNTLFCGPCEAGQTCSGGRCVACTPTITCADTGWTCGIQGQDDCGNTINCGGCATPTCLDMGAQCGRVPVKEPFGPQAINCGSCPAGQVCSPYFQCIVGSAVPATSGAQLGLFALLLLGLGAVCGKRGGA